MVYNKRDQLVLTQDGKQRIDKKWSFVKYDGLGRQVMTGIYTHATVVDQLQMQGQVDADPDLFETRTAVTVALPHGYTNTAFPASTEITPAPAWLPLVGANSISATPYTLTNGTGTKGTANSINFTVVNSATNQSPFVGFTFPFNNSIFPINTDITFSVNATDNDGNIATVEYFQGTNKIGESADKPFSFTWPSVIAGSYTITAKATDNQGASTTSAPISIIVNTTSTTFYKGINLNGNDISIDGNLWNSQASSKMRSVS